MKTNTVERNEDRMTERKKDEREEREQRDEIWMDRQIDTTDIKPIYSEYANNVNLWSEFYGYARFL